MRRNSFTLVVVGASLLVGSGVMAASVVGSKHDMTVAPYSLNATTAGACDFCHTPHNAKPNLYPLWSHQTSTAVYTTYTNPTGTYQGGAPVLAGSVSLMCLSCHDGTVALENYGSVTTGTRTMGSGTWPTAPRLGTDLSNDHPVGFTYNTALATADGHLYDPSTKVVTALGGTITAKMLFANRLECASCHNPHDPNAGTATYQHFLRMPNTGSALCLACHNM